MRVCWLTLILFALCSSWVGINCEEEEGRDVVVRIEHSIGGKFQPRGLLTISNLRLSSDQFAVSDYRLQLNQNPLASDDSKSFAALADNDAYYTIRARSALSTSEGDWVFSSVKACALESSDFKDSIHLHVNSRGHVTSISYSTANDCSSNRPHEHHTKIQFNTAVALDLGLEGPKPILEATAPAPQPGTGQPQQEQAPQSFIARYWYYIVPAVLLMLLSGFGSQGEGNAQGAAAAGGRVAAAPGPRR